MDIGTEVELHSLSRFDWNGVRGIIHGDEGDRVVVRLETGSQKKVCSQQFGPSPSPPPVVHHRRHH